MKISNVSVSRVSGHWHGPAFPAGDRQSRQLDVYPEFDAVQSQQMKDGQAISALYVQITTDDGVSGIFGPIKGRLISLQTHVRKPFTFLTRCVII